MAKQRTEPGAGIRSVPTPWREIILVCRKCTKKLDGGFGGKREQGLRQALREALRAGGQRRRDVRIMEIGCVGLCPRGAVTASRASRPHELLAIRKGADVATVLARLTE
jgi:predicted metal-binding protein